MTLQQKIAERRAQFLTDLTMPPTIALELLEELRKDTDERISVLQDEITQLNKRVLDVEGRKPTVPYQEPRG
jgi:hypothetical protein